MTPVVLGLVAVLAPVAVATLLVVVAPLRRMGKVAAGLSIVGALASFGASLALIVASGIGVLAGSAISQFVSAKQLSYVAGIGFIAIGVWTLVKA